MKAKKAMVLASLAIAGIGSASAWSDSLRQRAQSISDSYQPSYANPGTGGYSSTPSYSVKGLNNGVTYGTVSPNGSGGYNFNNNGFTNPYGSSFSITPYGR